MTFLSSSLSLVFMICTLGAMCLCGGIAGFGAFYYCSAGQHMAAFGLRGTGLLLAITGSSMFFLKFLGLCGSAMESKWITRFFYGFLVVGLALQGVCGILVLVKEAKLSDSLEVTWSKSSDITRDNIQKNNSCCGFYEVDEDIRCSHIYHESCGEKIVDAQASSLKLVSTIIFATTLVDVLLLLLSIFLAKLYARQEKEYKEENKSSYFRRSSASKAQSAPTQCGPRFHGHECENTSQKLTKLITPKNYQWSMTGSQWITEAQTYYFITYSNLSWPAQTTCQIMVRFFDPKSGEKGRGWTHSVSANKMKMSTDKRSVQVKEMNIQCMEDSHKPFELKLEFEEDGQIEVSLAFTPLADAFSVLDGNWYFGVNRRDGFINMKFIPFGKVSGYLKLDGVQEEYEGYGMSVHQFQGVKPYLSASKWNVVYFQEDPKEGDPDSIVSVFMIQIKTPAAYDAVVYNIGSIYVGGKLVGVSTGNNLEELGRTLDPESHYKIPTTNNYTWSGVTFTNEPFEVKCVVDPSNLAHKINILDHLPFFLRKAIEAFVTRPYVYFWMDRAELDIKIGDQESKVKGWIMQELSLINAD